MLTLVSTITIRGDRGVISMPKLAMHMKRSIVTVVDSNSAFPGLEL